MLEALVPLLSTFTGAAGAIWKSREERKQQQLQFEHDQRMFELQLQETKLEAEAAVRVVEAEGAIAADIADSETFKASYGAIHPWFKGAKKWWLLALDGVRSMVRPIVTFYLLGLTTFIAVNVGNVVGGLTGLPVDSVTQIYENIILSIISLTMNVTGWWFGSRPSSSRKAV